MKFCSKCKVEKSLSEFFVNSNAKSGRASNCKGCKKLYSSLAKVKIAAKKKEWYECNKEAVSLASKKYRVENPEICKEKEHRKYLKNIDKIKLRMSQYQKDFPEINRKASKKYRQSTPDKQCAKSARYRTRKFNAVPIWADSEWEKLFLVEIYHLSKLRSAMTGVPHQVDHRVPLKSDLVCGLHCSDNLQILEWHSNISKSNRFWEDMP